MSMLGHYTKLFAELGYIEIEESKPGDNPEPVDWLPPWDYNITKINEDPPRGVIHVGCHDCPEQGCYVPLFGSNVVWIEANKQSYDDWVVPTAKRWNQWAFNLAASDTTGNGYYYHNGSNETSGLLPATGKSPSFSIVKEQKLDELVLEHNINMDNFDFLNIDVEGAEHKVLKGFEDHIDKIRFLFVEVSNNQRNEGQMVFSELNEYIESLGFSLHKVSDSINTLDWGDAFYVRN